MKTIIDDADLQLASQGSQAKHEELVSQASKDQEYARVTVIDGTDRVPQFEPTKTQGLRKSPTKIVQGLQPAEIDPNTHNA